MADGGSMMGAVGGAAGMVPALFGRGKNDRKAVDFTHDDAYNPNAGKFGGREGVDEEMANNARQQQNQAQAKANEYGAQQQGLYNRGNVGMDQAQAARGLQMDAAGMARARATGQAPSIAQMQADRQMGQAAAAQASAAASARGPAALALAQQNAAANTAGAQANISGQAQIAAAQERLAAEQSYAQQAGAIRGGDFQGAQTAYGASGQMGQLGLGQGQLGLGYAQNELGVRQGAAQAANQQQATLAQSHSAAENANQQTAGQNAQSKGLIESVGDFFSDMNAKEYLGPPPGDAKKPATGMAFAAPGAADRGGAPDGIPAAKGDAGAPWWLQALGNAGTSLSAAQFGEKPLYSDEATKKMVDDSAITRSMSNSALGNILGMQKGGGYDFEKTEMSASSGPGDATFDVLNANGGMDVGATDAKHKAFGVRYGTNPSAGTLYSDEKTKDYEGALTLDDPNLRIGLNGRGYIAKPETQEMDAGQRLAASRKGKAEAPSKPKAAPKKMSDDEMLKWARERLGATQAQKSAQLANGPSVSASPMAQANRALQGAPYAYKEGFRPPEQAPGEVNVGPTAQVMERSPVTATAVRRDPQTGVRSLDRDKMLKVVASGVADLQRQQDETRLMLGGGGRG